MLFARFGPPGSESFGPGRSRPLGPKAEFRRSCEHVLYDVEHRLVSHVQQ